MGFRGGRGAWHGGGYVDRVGFSLVYVLGMYFNPLLQSVAAKELSGGGRMLPLMSIDTGLERAGRDRGRGGRAPYKVS